MNALQILLGGALVLGYAYVESRGMVFSGGDERPRPGYVGGGSRGGGGIFVWGSGYRGGK